MLLDSMINYPKQLTLFHFKSFMSWYVIYKVLEHNMDNNLWL